jgi:hypothetical protein
MTYQKDPERRDPLRYIRRDGNSLPALLIVGALSLFFGAASLLFSYRSDPHGPTTAGQRTEAPPTPAKRNE